jgi:hypothetical protein
MTFRGFDVSAYPGDQAMTALRKEFDVCGYYLRGPSHPDQSWLGRREFLVGLGFGLLPIFVGQETVGPGSHVMTAEQGALDGAAAALRLADEGFAQGSRVYLDLENGPPFGAQQGAYVAAMVEACEAERMLAGVYVSHAMVPALLLRVPALRGRGRVWTFRVPTVSRTTAAAPFTPPNPVLGGYSDAVAWQYRQNVQITVGGHSLVVDLDTADEADPSAPIPDAPN